MDICPVTGQPCPHKRCVHVTDVGPNYVAENEYHLCKICGLSFVEQSQPKTAQQISPVQVMFLELLKWLLSGGVAPKSAAVMPAPEMVPPPQLPPGKPPCPICGTTLHEIAQTSRLGCEVCYEHFRDELLPVFSQFHRAIQHVGKKPHAGLGDDIGLLELQLTQAIEQEQFEKAAEIKKRLEELRGEGH